jgi:hypothetical protein
MSRVGDELLAVVSARKQMSWRAFREAFDVLHSRALKARDGINEPVAFVRRRSLRLLADLGHCEFAQTGSTITVCASPSVLARLPLAGLPAAVVCGSRSFESFECLRDACAHFGREARIFQTRQTQSGGYVPSVITVEVDYEAMLHDVAAEVGIRLAGYSPAWRLLRYSGSVAQYEATLDWNEEPDPSWPRRDFSYSTMTFGINHDGRQRRLSSFQDPITQRQIHRLWQDGRVATVERDWGRWMYLRDVGTAAVLFDTSKQRLAIPSTAPLPGILARAISLFSGLAPIRRSGVANQTRAVDVYSRVSNAAAQLLAVKLGQTLDLTSIS